MSTSVAPSAVPAVGSPAPDFTLPSTSGEQITLSELRGRPVLIAFFPLAFTSTCTAELCGFTDDYAAYAEHDVVVLPTSVDSVPTLKEFKAKYDMKVDLLSDFKREVSRKYGVLSEERFHSTRAYFLVDREGILRWVFVEPNPGLKRENAEILAELAKLA